MPLEKDEKVFKDTLDNIDVSNKKDADKKLKEINSKLSSLRIKIIKLSDYQKRYLGLDDISSEWMKSASLAYEMQYITSSGDLRRGTILIIVPDDFIWRVIAKKKTGELDKELEDLWQWLEHELIHKKQDLKSGYRLGGSDPRGEEYYQKLSKEERERIYQEIYYGNPQEIMAHAYSVAKDLFSSGKTEEESWDEINKDGVSPFQFQSEANAQVLYVYKYEMPGKKKKLFYKYLGLYLKKLFGKKL